MLPTSRSFWGTLLRPSVTTADAYIDLSGEAIPINPLDITRVAVIPLPLNGTITNVTLCLNSWSAFDLSPSFTGLDVLLGDAFLRNVYASYVPLHLSLSLPVS